MNINCRILSVLLIIASVEGFAATLVDTIAKVKPSVVGVGTFEPLASPRANLQGTGFVVANGQYVITNYHVISTPLNEAKNQSRVIFVGTGRQPRTYTATLIEFDELHDLALLKVDVTLPALNLAESEYLQDGTELAFTGFPIGSVLGLYPATHRGIIAAVTPVIIPTMHSSQLDKNTVRRLRDPYYVYQLDGTAYPGNSGSAVYRVNDGKVVAVINKVFVKSTKEAVLSDPSGITYAIPVKYVKDLLESAGIGVP